MSHSERLSTTVQALLQKGKGILAADESPTNLSKKFSELGVENTASNRKKYREMLFDTPGLEQYISGIILHDETLHQFCKHGVEFGEYLLQRGILPGLKIDQGTFALHNSPLETITRGLEGLADRLDEAKIRFAMFAKWRSVIRIDTMMGLPTSSAIEENMMVLAECAKICQAHGLVPIIEPEILIEGDHSIDVSYRVTSETMHCLNRALDHYEVNKDYVLLKPSMILPGLKNKEEISVEEVAEKTVMCFKNTVSDSIPGIVFLSGGQSDEKAVDHLRCMNQLDEIPWTLSFSYGRALHRRAMELWRGKDENAGVVQEALLSQAKLCSLAAQGKDIE